MPAMNYKYLNIITLVLLLFLTVLYIVILPIITSQPKVPNIDSILNHKDLSQTLIKAKNIQGLELYFDVDAMLFRYQTELINDDDFFLLLSRQLKHQNWEFLKVGSRKEYCFINKKEKFGEIRVKKQNSNVFVGYWKSTSDQSKFAEKFLWDKL